MHNLGNPKHLPCARPMSAVLNSNFGVSGWIQAGAGGDSKSSNATFAHSGLHREVSFLLSVGWKKNSKFKRRGGNKSEGGNSIQKSGSPCRPVAFSILVMVPPQLLTLFLHSLCRSPEPFRHEATAPHLHQNQLFTWMHVIQFKFPF